MKVNIYTKWLGEERKLRLTKDIKTSGMPALGFSHIELIWTYVFENGHVLTCYSDMRITDEVDVVLTQMHQKDNYCLVVDGVVDHAASFIQTASRVPKQAGKILGMVAYPLLLSERAFIVNSCGSCIHWNDSEEGCRNLVAEDSPFCELYQRKERGDNDPN